MDAIPGKPIELRKAQRVGVDGARVDRAHPVDLRRRRVGTDLGANSVRHVCDQVEYVESLARVAFRPEVIVAPAVDKLDCHLDRAAFPQQAALDQGVHAQFAGDIGRGQLAVPVAFRGLPGRNPQAGELRKLRYQEVLDAVDVVVLLRVSGQVAQRQHRERADRLSLRSLMRRCTEPENAHDDQRDHRGSGQEQASVRGSRVGLS